MKIAVMFESKTGNTELIARAIRDEIGEDIVYYGAPSLMVDADLYVIGSWTDKGACVDPISTLLSSLRDKKIAYFCTAGFGVSSEYTDRIVERAESFIDPSNDIVGAFACQGKMPISVRDRYEAMIHANPEDEHIKVMIENFDAALSHPDDVDIANARAWIRDIVDELAI